MIWLFTMTPDGAGCSSVTSSWVKRPLQCSGLVRPDAAHRLGAEDIAEDRRIDHWLVSLGLAIGVDVAEQFHQVLDLDVFERSHGILDLPAQPLFGAAEHELVELLDGV